MRTGGSEAGAAAADGVAHTGSDSSHGSAMETPRPRRKVRRVVRSHMAVIPGIAPRYSTVQRTWIAPRRRVDSENPPTVAVPQSTPGHRPDRAPAADC